MAAVHVVGECRARIFGLRPAERLQRQSGGLGDMLLVADASAVLADATLDWLRAHPGTLLASDQGRPLAILVPAEEKAQAEAAFAGVAGGYTPVTAAQAPDMFDRKLRRREKLLALSLEEEHLGRAERLLFDSVYKGVTDLVTKYAWPVPAFWATRFCAAVGIHPNVVTTAGMVLTLAAGWLFFQGEFAAAMAAAWLMTFLDTVDGKLARVTVTSSPLGNILDHGTDYIHPPLWWLCLAYGLASGYPTQSDLVWISCWIILATYVAGRVVEELFKSRLGFNQYLWRRFDSAFRLIVSRRNVILLIMSMGFLAGVPVAAFAACASWSIISVLIQAARLWQGLRAQPIRSWLM